MADGDKRGMSRRQAENLAKGNPAIKRRLDAGEFDGSPRAPARKAPGKPRKPPVSAGAPPARPRARSSSPGETRPPRRSRDNGQPDEPPRRGVFRSIFDGLFDI